MSKPLPLPVFDRRSNKLFHEFMDDSAARMRANHTDPLSMDHIVPVGRLDDRRIPNTRRRKIEPFIRKQKIESTSI
jgi:hypothetical protein